MILIAYLSMGFSVIRTPNTWEFKVNWSAATVRLSRYVTYENGSREFRLFLPAGMAVYWIMKKRLDRESVHRKHERPGSRPGESCRPGNLAQEKRGSGLGNDQAPGECVQTGKPARRMRADRETGPEKRAGQETRREQRPDTDRESWRIP